jgi:uncharacterized repeat protein (TIGR03803 family)
MRRLANRFTFGCAAFVITASITGMALAQSTETVLYKFGSTVDAGAYPYASPVIDASSGLFYGVAGDVIYQLSPPTAAQPKWTYTVIYGNDTTGNPAAPVGFYNAFVDASNGIVYYYGAGQNGSAIVSLTPPSSGTGQWTPTVLHTFSSTTGIDGAAPQGPLTMDANGALYGTSYYGGGTGCVNNFGCGMVFKLAPPTVQGQAWTFSVLYKFSGGAGGYGPGDGVILDKDGNLYGSTRFDYPSQKSLIFKLTPPTGAGEWTESVLYRFYPTSNCYSSGPLTIDANGALYGAFSAYASVFGNCTNAGDNANEYVFQLAPSKSDPDIWVRTYLHTFTSSNLAAGYRLTAPVTVDAGGNVYGATLGGGTADTGTVFVMRPRAKVTGKWNYQALFDFSATTGKYNKNTTGAYPDGGLLIDSAGNLYGATRGGGSGGYGVLFSLTP